jgi:hypothetical protein
MKFSPQLLTSILLISISQFASARSWTCWLQASAGGTSWTWTESMSGGFLADREQACRNWARNTVSSKPIWGYLGTNSMSQANITAICAAKGGNIHVEYAFMTTTRRWSVDVYRAASCYTTPAGNNAFNWQ